MYQSMYQSRLLVLAFVVVVLQVIVSAESTDCVRKGIAVACSRAKNIYDGPIGVVEIWGPYFETNKCDRNNNWKWVQGIECSRGCHNVLYDCANSFWHTGYHWNCVREWHCENGKCSDIVGECLDYCDILLIDDPRVVSKIHVIASTSGSSGAGSDYFPRFCLKYNDPSEIPRWHCTHLYDKNGDDMQRRKTDWWMFNGHNDDFNYGRTMNVDYIESFAFEHDAEWDGWKVEDISIIIETEKGGNKDILVPVLHQNLNKWVDNEYHDEFFVELPQRIGWKGSITCASNQPSWKERDNEVTTAIDVIATTAEGTGSESDYKSFLKIFKPDGNLLSTMTLDDANTDDFTEHKSDWWTKTLVGQDSFNPQDIGKIELMGDDRDPWKLDEIIVLITTYYNGFENVYVPVLNREWERTMTSTPQQVPQISKEIWSDNCKYDRASRRSLEEKKCVIQSRYTWKQNDRGTLSVIYFKPKEPDASAEYAEKLHNRDLNPDGETYIPFKHQDGDLYIVSHGKTASLAGSKKQGNQILTHDIYPIEMKSILEKKKYQFNRIFVYACKAGGTFSAQLAKDFPSKPVFGFGSSMSQPIINRVGGSSTTHSVKLSWISRDPVKEPPKFPEFHMQEDADEYNQPLEEFGSAQVQFWHDLYEKHRYKTSSTGRQIDNPNLKSPYISHYNPTPEVDQWVKEAMGIFPEPDEDSDSADGDLRRRRRN